ncbi:alanine racemase [Pyruvatibacter mobilis]|uniref:alanine racemase n=1 Tax=Pyruvatibacter mobilis TaxID=1712261 RepID=UPI003BAA32A0
MTSTPPSLPASGLSASGSLTIDLGALARNWRAAHEASGTARASAVIKADGYGLGAVEVARTLAEAGCRDFFVALPSEGIAVRSVAPDAAIYVLNGPMAGHVDGMADAGLIPVLNGPEQLALWAQAGDRHGRPLPASVMLDTGMNRLGFDEAALDALAPDAMHGIDLRLVLSHLACADDPSADMNIVQRAQFNRMRSRLPDVEASLCNSAGIFLGPDYHYELTRPGVCLYGGSPFIAEPAPFHHVVTVGAEVVQLRNVPAGETIGYGATFTAASDMRTATIAAGYADGIFRAAGNRGFAAINGVRVPYVGRVSMDLVVLDITALPDGAVRPGDQAEVLGPTISVDDLAQASGTIGYEVLTSLGSRYERRYIAADFSQF